jgi:predicted RNA-binding Zn-ribbon protein involved in translation (DUF1610 family)
MENNNRLAPCVVCGNLISKKSAFKCPKCGDKSIYYENNKKKLKKISKNGFLIIISMLFFFYLVLKTS